MIPQSRIVGGFSCVVALGVNLGIGALFFSEVDVQTAGAGAPQIAIQGSSFADLVAGTNAALEVDQVTSDVTPTATPQTEPQDVTEREVPQLRADAPDSAVSDVPEPTQTNQVEPTGQTTVRPSQSANVMAPTNTMLAPVVASPQPQIVAPTVNTAVKLEAVQPAPTARVLTALAPAEQVDAPPIEELVAEDLNPAAVQRSLRPSVRPDGLAPKRPTPQPAQVQPQRPRGNASQTASAGTKTTRTDGTAVQSGSGAQTEQVSVVSNADTSNYRGLVLRRLARAKRITTRLRGAAVIEVRIARDGSAAAIRVQRASGIAEFDQFALNAVRSVASFPPPPSGAQTAFRVEITGR